jgi:Fe-S-cluster containining protein
MSLPELFHHEHRFVGCLSLRRVKRLRLGETLDAGPERFALSVSDADAIDVLAGALHFTLGDAFYLSIQTQALDYASLGRCPMLGEDKRCAIHEDRKPRVCSMVPFDAAFPDRLQAAVLASRNFEENCLLAGRVQDYEIVLEQGNIAHSAYQSAVESRRADLLADKAYFGDAVFALLRTALLSDPSQLNRIPVDGFFSLSIVPALLTIAAYSHRCRTRCVQYVDSQIALIDSKIQQAKQRRNSADKPLTAELAGYKTAYLQCRQELLAASKPSPNGQAAAVEQYLGIAS